MGKRLPYRQHHWTSKTLRGRREFLGLTQDQVAKAANISWQSVQRIDQGYHGNFRLLSQYAKVVGLKFALLPDGDHP